MQKKPLAILMVAIAVVASASTAFAGSTPFPKAGQYVINSQPSFEITVGDNKETITCEATLLLKAGDPYVTAKGTRRVDLQVIDWKAKGHSKLLGGNLDFRMLKGVKVDDPSFVETSGIVKAGQADFPAQAQFAVPYEIKTPFGVVSNLVGVTRGSIKAFPPRGDTFVMEKGDIAKLMAELMPAPLSAMSAAGEVSQLEVTIRPEACFCPDPTEISPEL